MVFYCVVYVREMLDCLCYKMCICGYVLVFRWFSYYFFRCWIDLVENWSFTTCFGCNKNKMWIEFWFSLCFVFVVFILFFFLLLRTHTHTAWPFTIIYESDEWLNFFRESTSYYVLLFIIEHRHFFFQVNKLPIILSLLFIQFKFAFSATWAHLLCFSRTTSTITLWKPAADNFMTHNTKKTTTKKYTQLKWMRSMAFDMNI